MVREKRVGIPLTARVVSTSLGNFFGHVGIDGIQHLAKSLRGPYWEAGTESVTLSRGGVEIAKGKIRFLRGDGVLVWTKGTDLFGNNAFMDADSLQVDDLLCVEPGPPPGKRVAPFFDRICWNHMTGVGLLGERPYIE